MNTNYVTNSFRTVPSLAATAALAVGGFVNNATAGSCPCDCGEEYSIRIVWNPVTQDTEAYLEGCYCFC
jgi:hypothetical protein